MSKVWNWIDQFPLPKTRELCKKMQKQKKYYRRLRNLKVKVIDKVPGWRYSGMKEEISMYEEKKTIQSFEK